VCWHQHLCSQFQLLEYSNHGFSDFSLLLRVYQEQLREKANPHIWSCLCKRKKQLGYIGQWAQTLKNSKEVESSYVVPLFLKLNEHL
jgi:hypothetical protein